MAQKIYTTTNKERRRKKIRAKISGTSTKPRLCVFKSNRFIYAQLIDDEANKTLAATSSKEISGTGMVSKAHEAGKKIAQAAVKKNIKKAVFDRGGNVYTGAVKALADGAREGGLLF